MGSPQMLAKFLSQHPVSIIHGIPWGHDKMDIPESHWLRFGLMRHTDRLMQKQVSPLLCMDAWNLPTPVQMRLSRSQANRGRPMLSGLELALAWPWDNET